MYMCSLKKAGRKAKAKTGAGYAEYQREDLVDFIRKIEKHPILYDASIDNSHRREVLQKIYDEIEKSCKKYMPRGKNAHGNTAKKLWEQLLHDYKAYKKRIVSAASGSGVTGLIQFAYAREMEFVDAAVAKRLVENTYILGSRDHCLMEAEKSADSLAEEKMEALALRTPKRPRVSNEQATPVSKRSRKGDDVMDALMEQLKNTDERIVEAVKGASGGASCKSEMLCTVFAAHTADWADEDRFVTAAHLVTYIKSLKPPGQTSLAPSYQHAHFQERPPYPQYSDSFPTLNVPSSSSTPSSSQANQFDWDLHDL